MRRHHRLHRHHDSHPDDSYYREAPHSAAQSAAVRGHALRLSFILALTAVLILCVLVVTSEAQTVDPYEILERYAEAMGGMEKLRASVWMRTMGTLEVAGLTGTVETWQGPGRLNRQELDLGVFVETSGDDGTSVWQQDANGKVQIVEDENALLRREVDSRVVAYEPFDRNSDVFSVEYAGEDDVDGAPCHVIRITNSINDDVIEMSIDATSYLATRRRDIQPDMVATTHLDDYREVGGVLYPFETTTLIEPPGQEQLLRVTEVEVADGFDPTLFAVPADGARDFRFTSGAPFEVVPMRFHENHIFVLVEMAGQQGLWVLDSGASTTCIDEGFARDLGLEM